MQTARSSSHHGGSPHSPASDRPRAGTYPPEQAPPGAEPLVAGTPTPRKQAPSEEQTLWSRHPSAWSRHPPRSRYPSRSRHPWEQTLSEQAPPSWPDPPQLPPWVWAWTRSPSTFPLGVGLETPQQNPTKLPSRVWAWKPARHAWISPPRAGTHLGADPLEQAPIPLWAGTHWEQTSQSRHHPLLARSPSLFLLGVGLDQIPSTSPFGLGLKQIPLNFPLGLNGP